MGSSAQKIRAQDVAHLNQSSVRNSGRIVVAVGRPNPGDASNQGDKSILRNPSVLGILLWFGIASLAIIFIGVMVLIAFNGSPTEAPSKELSLPLENRQQFYQ